MKKVFWKGGNLPPFALGEIPLISVDFSDKYATKKFEKNSTLKGHKFSKEFTTQYHHFWVGGNSTD